MRVITATFCAILCSALLVMPSDGTSALDQAKADENGEENQEKEPRRDAKLFKRLFEGRVAGEPQNCLSSFNRSNPIPVGEDVIAFRDRGIIYRNNLKGLCRGLSDNDILVPIIRSGSLCNNDRVRRINRVTGAQRSLCVLGEFVPYKKADKAAD